MKEIKYYKFWGSTSLKETGIIQQVQDLTIKATQEIMHGYQNKVYDTFTDNIPDFKVLKLHRQAKITDVLNAGQFLSRSDGFIVNAKVKNVLEGYKSENFKFYDAMITDWQGKTYPYYVFGVNLSPEIIDYKQSEFMITNYLRNKNIEPIAINSFKELQKKEESIANIKLNKVILKRDWDVLKLPLHNALLISERLRQAFIAEKITGTTFNESGVSFFID